jgi:hypothetical protein
MPLDAPVTTATLPASRPPFKKNATGAGLPSQRYARVISLKRLAG